MFTLVLLWWSFIVFRCNAIIPALSGVTCDETTTENYDSTSRDICWVKIAGCAVEGGDTIWIDESAIPALLPHAISLRFIPASSYNEYAVVAKPCSNPVWAINNEYEVSFVLNTNTGVTLDFQDGNSGDWIGSANAKARLDNKAWEDPSQGQTPRSFFDTMYQATDGSGLHLAARNPKYCAWTFGQDTDPDIEVYIGFETDLSSDCYTTSNPTSNPTTTPTTATPSKYPTLFPTKFPTKYPTENPTKYPSTYPTETPSKFPTKFPTQFPTKYPTKFPTKFPTKYPTENPSTTPTETPSNDPTFEPTIEPTNNPSITPTMGPIKTNHPSTHPTVFPTSHPTCDPTNDPTIVPTDTPTAKPTDSPSTSPVTDGNIQTGLRSTVDSGLSTDKNGNFLDMLTGMVPLLILAVLLILVFLCCCFVCIYWRNSNRKLRNSQKNIELAEMASSSDAIDTELMEGDGTSTTTNNETATNSQKIMRINSVSSVEANNGQTQSKKVEMDTPGTGQNMGITPVNPMVAMMPMMMPMPQMNTNGMMMMGMPTMPNMMPLPQMQVPPTVPLDSNTINYSQVSGATPMGNDANGEEQNENENEEEYEYYDEDDAEDDEMYIRSDKQTTQGQ